MGLRDFATIQIVLGSVLWIGGAWSSEASYATAGQWITFVGVGLFLLDVALTSNVLDDALDYMDRKRTNATGKHPAKKKPLVKFVWKKGGK